MRLIEGHDTGVAAWLGEKLGVKMVRPYAAFGLISMEGRLAGAFLYNGYNGCNCDLTAYGPRAFDKSAIRFMFDYPFVQLKALRLTARTRRGNGVARRILPRLGFAYEGTARHYYGASRNDDALVFGMLKDNCRWIDGRA